MKIITASLVLGLFVGVVFVRQSFAQTPLIKDSLNNPVFPRGPAGEWDDELVAGPSVVFDGTTYHMWYAGYDGSTGTRIGYAHSSDGITWVRDTQHNPVLGPGPAGSWDEVTVFQPSVIFDGTGYHMWYGGHDLSIRRIGYATSPDGITWTKYDDPTTTAPAYSESDPVLDIGPPGSWDDDYVDSPEVLFVDGIFHMWYSGNDDTNQDRYTRTGYATSADGIIWTKYDDPTTTAPPYSASDPVLDVGPPGSWDDVMSYQPAVLYDGRNNRYHMYYSGGRVFNWSIGYAYSTDGRNWTKYDDPATTAPPYDHSDPVLDIGITGSWESAYVGLSGVTFNVDSSGVKLWYTGGTGTAVGDIGYATSYFESPVEVEGRSDTELPLGSTLRGNYPNPFNPATTISYDLARTGEATLKVFDILGREIRTLTSGVQSAGSYEVHFDATGLPTGVYLYRLQAGDYVETKRMVVVR